MAIIIAVLLAVLAPVQFPASQAATSRPAAVQKPAYIMYRGQPRTEDWFDRMHARFADTIIHVDDGYVSICEALARYRAGDGSMLEKTAIMRLPSYASPKVLQIIGKTEMLVSWGGRNPSVVHIAGMDTAGLYDGARLENGLFFLVKGTYRYVSVSDANSTVPSLEPYRPVTKAEFREAIEGGLRLVMYTAKWVNGNIRVKATPIP